MGLGLAIASQAASLLGAGLTVQSQLGVGSTFRLTLPENAADLTRDSNTDRPASSHLFGASATVARAQRPVFLMDR